jgi:pilus assembly protein Flp/PilA
LYVLALGRTREAPYFVGARVGPSIADEAPCTRGKTHDARRNDPMIRTLLKDEQGASMAEYAMLLALIAVATITAVQGLRTAIVSVFNTSATTLGTAK